MLRVTPAYCLNLKSAGFKRPVGVRATLSTSTPITHPPVFDLLIVSRCALRLCFFLASRASAYLFVACGEADFFSTLALVSWPALGSELTGVVLIFCCSSKFLLLIERRLFGSSPVSQLSEATAQWKLQYTRQWCANSAMASLFSSGPAATQEPQLTHWDSIRALFSSMTKRTNW